MKIVFIFICLFSFSLSNAQFKNPDGNKASIHLTAYTYSGFVKFNGFENDINSNLCYKLQLKLPMWRSFTISPFLEYNNMSYLMPINKINYPFEQNLFQYGATLSFYFL
jgi:hypothetical protein